MAHVTLEVLLDGAWERAAVIEFPSEVEGAGGQCFFEYEYSYFEKWVGQPRADVAASLKLPLEFGPSIQKRWPAFLDDIRPMADARRWWLSRLRLPDEPSSDFRLLRAGTVAPIGNLRIRESVPPKEDAPRFPVEAVLTREHAFIQWAADHGAQVGGATGAGGDSPKLLLRREPGDLVWIDVWQDEPLNPATHVLVKFPRRKTERDRQILRSEYVYYRALQRLGLSTVSAEGLELRESASGPSLWLPRFDVQRSGAREVRLGVESMYSLLSAAPGARLRHEEVLEVLQRLVPPAEWPRVLVEYVKRDLLNLVFGNSDNHGRNTSVLKSASGVSLAPIYDFAPMKMDEDGIARSTVWRDCERGGDVDWPRLLVTFGEHEQSVRDGVRELAARLTGLPALLRELELPRETLEFPGIGLLRTEERLRAWGLL